METGIASVVAVQPDNTQSEVGLIGREGDQRNCSGVGWRSVATFHLHPTSAPLSFPCGLIHSNSPLHVTALMLCSLPGGLGRAHGRWGLAAEPWPRKYEAAFRENEIDETVLPSLTHET